MWSKRRFSVFQQDFRGYKVEVARARSTMAVIDSRQRKSFATIRVSLTPSTPSADTTQHRDAATVRNERRLRKTPEFGTRRLDLATSGPRNTWRTCPL